MLLDDLIVAKLLSKFGYTADNQTKYNDTTDSVRKYKPAANVIRREEVSETDSQYRYIGKVQG